MKKGKTTRIIDRCIQELFTNGFTYVYDGRGTDRMKTETQETFFKFKTRLNLEHPSVKYTYKLAIYSGIECYKIELHNL